MSDDNFTKIEELGEFELINHLTKNFKIQNESTIKAIGDDCAVISNTSCQTLISSDMFVEGIHFDFVYTPLQHLGYKAIIAGISDIYAMNGIAEQLIVSIGVSNRFSVEMMETLYRGMTIACESYSLDFVGGDTTTTKGGLVINVTAIGRANSDDIVYRNGARNKDLIYVTGDLGAAYTGLLILEREKKVFNEIAESQPQLEGYDYILKRQLRPEARKDIVQIFKDIKVRPTSMIDISDGLSSEIIHICKQSGKGCKIFEDKVPIDPTTYETAIELNLDPITCALNGGEDYELLFTIDQQDYEKIKGHPDFTAIGHITDQEQDCRLITKSGNEYQLEAQGWKAFNK